MVHKIKIATILPYKENYTYKKAAAASLWVADFFRRSRYKKIILYLVVLIQKIIYQKII